VLLKLLYNNEFCIPLYCIYFQSEISDIYPVPPDWLEDTSQPSPERYKNSPKNDHTRRIKPKEVAKAKKLTRPRDPNRAAQLLQQADNLLKEKQQKRSAEKPLEATGPSVADCMRSAPELLLSCGRSATGRWLDMLVDVVVVELTDVSLAIPPPPALVESYDFELEREVLGKLEN
jgi:hypothetical protein